MLFVDDEKPIVFAVKQYFAALRYEVDCATEREEAEDLLQNTQYDVVIADLCLSKTDGYEGLDLITLVRRQCPQTRTILLTAYGDGEIEREAYRRGVDVFLHKPQPLPELHRIISSILENDT